MCGMSEKNVIHVQCTIIEEKSRNVKTIIYSEHQNLCTSLFVFFSFLGKVSF